MSDPTPEGRLRAAFPRREEAYAASVVEHVLRAQVEPRDVSGAPQGTVDGEIIYTGGKTAALEITGVQRTTEHHLRARIDRIKPTPAPGRLMWTIRPKSVTEIERLVAIHKRVIFVCEKYGVTNPEDLPLDVISSDPDLRWLAWEQFLGRMSGYFVANDPKVWWMYPIETVVLDDEGEVIAAGVAAALKMQPCLSHIAKLLRDPHEERHLFLVVGSTGLGNAAAFALVGSEAIPDHDPDLPHGIDHLWLGPGWGGTVTVWTRDRGWRNEHFPVEPRQQLRARRTRPQTH